MSRYLQSKYNSLRYLGFVLRFAWIRNRQYRQLRRLCCQILIHSVFALPESLLRASYCILFYCSAVTTACSTAAVPSYGTVAVQRKEGISLNRKTASTQPRTEKAHDVPQSTTYGCAKQVYGTAHNPPMHRTPTASVPAPSGLWHQARVRQCCLSE